MNAAELRAKAAELIARAKQAEATEKRTARKRRKRCAFLLGEAVLNSEQQTRTILPLLSAANQTYVRNVLGMEAPSPVQPPKPPLRNEA
jgi:hypothetical protein